MFAFLSSVEPVEPVMLANSNHPVKEPVETAEPAKNVEPVKYTQVVEPEKFVEFALLAVFEVLGTGLQAAGQPGVL